MRLTIWTAIWVLLSDQLTKFAVVRWMNLREIGEIDVFPPYLNFRMAWNRGINFGLFDTNRWVLIALALAICIWVIVWISRQKHRRLAYFSAGLLIGGALGNIADRLIYGAVADFLNMSCCGFENPYSFNVSDIAVFAGAFGLIFFAGEPKTR
ncbi:MAG TPA: signal peptidase II [Rhodobacteraceae bacterium]|nr:signal peptidase II [Paracoccaceae bacterium]